MKLSFGDFALCQKDEVGLILWNNEYIDKRTKKKYILYSGINLTPGSKFGLNWQSKNPKKITKSYLKKIIDGKLVGFEP